MDHRCLLCPVFKPAFLADQATRVRTKNSLCTPCEGRLSTGAIQTARSLEGKRVRKSLHATVDPGRTGAIQTARSLEGKRVRKSLHATVDLRRLLRVGLEEQASTPPDFTLDRVNDGVAALQRLHDDDAALKDAGLTKKAVSAVLDRHSQLCTGFATWLAAYWKKHKLAGSGAVDAEQATELAVEHLGDAAKIELGLKSGQDIKSDIFTMEQLRHLEWGSAGGFAGDAEAETVVAWAWSLGLAPRARRALLVAIADIHATPAPVIILQKPGDVLIAPPGWGHWVVTLRGQRVVSENGCEDREGAVSVVAWYTNARSRGSALTQLTSATGRELREGQMDSLTPEDIDIANLENRFASFNSWIDRRPVVPSATESTAPSLVAVGLSTVLDHLPDGRKSAGFLTKLSPPTVAEIIASVSETDWRKGDSLDVRLALQDETWVKSETFDDTTARPANHVLQFLLGTATEVEQNRFTRCDLRSLRLSQCRQWCTT